MSHRGLLFTDDNDDDDDNHSKQSYIFESEKN